MKKEKPLKFDATHSKILELICQKPYYDYNKIRKALGIKSTSTVPKKVKQLEEEGLVRIKSRGQGKSVYIEPTSLNKKLHIKILKKIKQSKEGIPLKKYYTILGSPLKGKYWYQTDRWLELLKYSNLLDIRVFLSDAGKKELSKLERQNKLKKKIVKKLKK